MIKIDHERARRLGDICGRSARSVIACATSSCDGVGRRRSVRFLYIAAGQFWA